MILVINFRDVDEKEWDAFCDKEKASFYHYSSSIKYHECIVDGVENRSFALIIDFDIVAVCPVFVSNGETKVFGMNSFFPCTNRDSKVLSFAGKEIARRSSDVNVFFETMGYFNEEDIDKVFNDRYIKAKFDCYAHSYNKSRKKRKSYRSLINTTRRETDVNIVDKTSDVSEIEKYFRFHKKVKGNNRSEQAFSIDEKFVLSGKQILLMCIKDDDILGAISIYVDNKRAYYNSAINVEDCSLYPNHLLLDTAIEYLDGKVDVFELGMICQNDKKNCDISFFKSGFANDIIEKYEIVGK